MFCAIGSWGKDASQGDSGGPASRKGNQVGIVSWVCRCGSTESPGVYTILSSPSVMKFLSFLIGIIVEINKKKNTFCFT